MEARGDGDGLRGVVAVALLGGRACGMLVREALGCVGLRGA